MLLFGEETFRRLGGDDLCPFLIRRLLLLLSLCFASPTLTHPLHRGEGGDDETKRIKLYTYQLPSPG